MSVELDAPIEETSDEPADADEQVASTVLSKDTVFEALANERRRRTLTYLDENDGTATTGELATCIAAAENGISVQELTSAQRKRVYVGLYQCHLPKLDEMGLVAFNKARGTVRLDADAATQVFPYLRLDPLADARTNSGLLSGLRSRLG